MELCFTVVVAEEGEGRLDSSRWAIIRRCQVGSGRTCDSANCWRRRFAATYTPLAAPWWLIVEAVLKVQMNHLESDGSTGQLTVSIVNISL